MGSPFDDLERAEPPKPGRNPPDRSKGETGALAALLRGARRRCPRCGGGGLFETWFRIRARCPRCGLRLER